MSHVRARAGVLSLATMMLLGASTTALAQEAAHPGLMVLDARLEALSRQVAPSVVQVVSSGYAAGGGAILSRARSYGSGAIDGVSVRGLAELRSAVGRPPAGESLVFQIERRGQLLYVVVELE